MYRGLHPDKVLRTSGTPPLLLVITELLTISERLLLQEAVLSKQFLLMEGSSGSAALQRLAVLSKQLVQGDPAQAVITRVDTKAEDEESRPAPGGGRGTLTVLDNRSGKKYTVRRAKRASCCVLMWIVMCAMRAEQQPGPCCWEHHPPLPPAVCTSYCGLPIL
jgi:hypothetical protein